MMHLHEIMDEFFRYLRIEKNASPLTIQAYRSDFKPLIQYLRDQSLPVRLETLSTPTIRRALLHIQEEKELSAASVIRHINSLRSFFNFCVLQEYLDRSPMLRIGCPKEPPRLPFHLSQARFQELLGIADRFAGKHALRDRTVVYALGYLGTRRTELINSDWDNVDFGQKTICVIGKGDKERLLPIHPRLADVLWTYLHSRLPLRNRALLLNDYGGRITKDNIQRVIHRCRKPLGLDQRFTPHTLRHTFATMLLEKAADLFTVQELLGHEDLESTRIYAHVTQQKKRGTVELLD